MVNFYIFTLSPIVFTRNKNQSDGNSFCLQTLKIRPFSYYMRDSNTHKHTDEQIQRFILDFYFSFASMYMSAELHECIEKVKRRFESLCFFNSTVGLFYVQQQQQQQQVLYRNIVCDR